MFVTWEQRRRSVCAELAALPQPSRRGAPGTVPPRGIPGAAAALPGAAVSRSGAEGTAPGGSAAVAVGARHFMLLV